MIYELRELCLEVTDTCVMDCRHCSSCSHRFDAGTPNHMALARAKQVIKELSGLGGKVVEISGGEPLLYPGLHELCRYASASHLEVRVYTSGVHPASENKLQEITPEEIEELKRFGVNKIIFNLEGASFETHEKITGIPGVYDLVIKGLQNAKAAGLWTGVHFVPMKPNFEELSDLAMLCSSLGINELALLRFVPQGRGEQNRAWLELGVEEFHEVLKKVILLMKKYPNLRIRAGCPLDFLSLFDRKIKPHQCKAGRSTCAISPKGDVIPCPGFKGAPDFIAGNIGEVALTTVWREGFQELRNLNCRDISGLCRQCDDLDFCQGRCAAQRKIAHGDITRGPDPGCPKQKSKSDYCSSRKPLHRTGETAEHNKLYGSSFA